MARLQDAVNKTVPHPDLRNLLMQTLVFESANPQCQRAVGPLKAQGAPSEEYITARMDIGSTSHKADLPAAALQTSFNKNKTRCFACGKTGHVKKDCIKGQRDGSNNPAKATPPGLCPVCGKGTRWASECRSKFNKAGQPLQRRGNWGKVQKLRAQE